MVMVVMMNDDGDDDGDVGDDCDDYVDGDFDEGYIGEYDEDCRLFL